MVTLFTKWFKLNYTSIRWLAFHTTLACSHSYSESLHAEGKYPQEVASFSVPASTFVAHNVPILDCM